MTIDSRPQLPDDRTTAAGDAVPAEHAAEHRRSPLDADVSAPSRRWWLLGLVALVLLALVAFWVARGRSSTTAGTQAAAPTSTSKVVRTNLTETTSYDGTLTFADSRSVTAKSAGTITWLPAASTTISQGQRLYAINAAPTVLLYGSVPMYRTLQSGVGDGTDVKQLETALKALGFDPDSMVVDGAWTSSTTAAVEAWQDAAGLTSNGIVTSAEVQFLPAPIRVSSLSATVGDTAGAGGTLYAATGTARIATVSLSAADSTVAKPGAAVRVTLPSGTTVPGKVTEVTTDTSSSSSSSSGSGGGGGGAVNQQGGSSTTSATKVSVTVSVTDPKAVGAPDQTPVSVAFTSAAAKGVLAVPVTALLALAGGGYAVEVVDAGGATHLAAVSPGLYAVGGMVEITGQGVADGTTVVVPASS